MKRVDNIAEKLKEVLKTEYGIAGKDEFEAAVRDFAGINLGIFTAPLPERRSECEYHCKTKITA